MRTIFALLIITLSAGTAYAGKVTLTADQVSSAADIEAAINTATAFGSEPGTVILDGSEGGFTYTALDRSINIFRSDVSLHGINGATITNCADGVFFDDFAVSNILIENITFHCTGHGITGIGTSLRENVRIKSNVLDAGGSGISIRNALEWEIRNNAIDAGLNAVALVGSSESVIENNKLSGNFGVRLVDSTEIDVLRNKIEAVQTGVSLEGATTDSSVIGNTIIAGGPCIFLGPGTARNHVKENRCFCSAPGCDAVEDLGTNNEVE